MQRVPVPSPTASESPGHHASHPLPRERADHPPPRERAKNQVPRNSPCSVAFGKASLLDTPETKLLEEAFDGTLRFIYEGMEMLQQSQARVEQKLDRMERILVDRPSEREKPVFDNALRVAPWGLMDTKKELPTERGLERVSFMSNDSDGPVFIANPSEKSKRHCCRGQDSEVASRPMTSCMSQAAGGSVGNDFRRRRGIFVQRFAELEAFRLNGVEVMNEKAAIEKRIEKVLAITPQPLQGSLGKTLAVAASAIPRTRQEPQRTGIIARVVDSTHFTVFTALVIAFNGVFMIITAGYGMERALANEDPDLIPLQMESIEWVLTIFYTVECVFKILVHRCFFFTSKGWQWNWIDFFLVLFSWLEFFLYLGVYSKLTTGADPANVSGSSRGSNGPNLMFLRSLRVLKVAKIVRMIRVFKFVEELRLMLDCVIGSFFQLFWCLALVSFVIYIFALFYVQAFTDFVSSKFDDMTDDEMMIISMLFGTVGPLGNPVLNTMVSLFEATTGGMDWKEMYNLIGKTGPLGCVLYILFIAFNVIVVWNIVTSTFVQKAVKLAKPDIETLIEEREADDRACARELLEWIVRSMDDDGSGTISKEEFKTIMDNKRFQKFLKVRELDLKDGETFFNMLTALDDDTDTSDEILVDKFVAACVRMQGTAAAIDLQALKYEMKCMHQRQNLENEHFNAALYRIEDSLRPVLVREREAAREAAQAATSPTSASSKKATTAASQSCLKPPLSPHRANAPNWHRANAGEFYDICGANDVDVICGSVELNSSDGPLVTVVPPPAEQGEEGPGCGSQDVSHKDSRSHAKDFTSIDTQESSPRKPRPSTLSRGKRRTASSLGRGSFEKKSSACTEAEDENHVNLPPPAPRRRSSELSSQAAPGPNAGDARKGGRGKSSEPMDFKPVPSIATAIDV